MLQYLKSIDWLVWLPPASLRLGLLCSLHLTSSNMVFHHGS